MSPVYRRPEPAYYWAPQSVEAEPIWGEPYHYYMPQDGGYGKYEGGPYWYRHGPAEDGSYYFEPKYRNWDPRLYERDGRDFGSDFGRNFRPVYVYPPAPATVSGPCAIRPFNPGDQFRHPDEYPMRFVPVTYGSSGPREIEHAKMHCCGCPNHMCHPETRPMKGIEWKGLMDGNSEEDAKAKPSNMQQLTGPVMWYNPFEWRNRAAESKDQNEEKEKGKKEYPAYWTPMIWNRNDGDKEKSGQFPGYWIPLASNQRPQGGEEEKNKFPGFWVPLDLNRKSQGGEEENKKLPGFWIPQDSSPSIRPQGQEGDGNKFPGYWIPLGPSTTPQGWEGDKKNPSFEGQSQPFPVFWIPEGNWTASNPQEGAKIESLEKEHKKTNGADGRPVTVQESGKEVEKQKPVEGKKETKIREIPVKQLEEEKSAQAQKTEEKVAGNHKVSSPRASKLPPVCLRVDPLPGKKKSNGKCSSRSPSPPRKEETAKDDIKPDASKVSVGTKEAEVNANSNASKSAGEAQRDDESKSLKASKLTKEVKHAEDLKASKVDGEAKKIELEEDMNAKDQEARDKKTEISRDQAALKIQALYQGYQVRKLQPLRKLCEIAKIRKRMEELKQQILSPEFVGELSRDNKTKSRMSETLMGLLLQLDTIQGLHPMVRDVRKSVARELDQLQEKLDTLVEGAHTRNSHPCARDVTEDNVSSSQEKIDDTDKVLEATEDTGKTLLNPSTENHQVDVEQRKDDENVREKETFEVSNDSKENVFVDKEANDAREGTENTTKCGENVGDNIIPVQLEALEVSDKLEVPSLPMHLQKAEIESQNENVMNERDKEEISDPSFENLSVEKEEKSEPPNFKESDSSALPQELDSAAETETCPASTLVQEQKGAASDNSKVLDGNAKVLEKGAILEQGGKWVVIEPEVEIGNEISTEKVEVSKVIEPEAETENQIRTEKVEVFDNSDEKGNALEKIATLEQGGNWVVIETEAEPGKQLSTEKGKACENLNVLDENANALEKNAALELGGKGMVIEPEAELENQIGTENLDATGSAENNKGESDEVQNALTETSAGDGLLAFNTETYSQTISDSLSRPNSDGVGKINLKKVDKSLPASQDLIEEENIAAAMAQGIDGPIVEKPMVAPITENGLSTVNPKNDLSVQNEKDAAECSGMSEGTGAGTSDRVEKLLMESSLNRNDENVSESETNISKSVRNQVQEKWEDENEKLREMVEKLVEAEKLQMSTIAQLNDKINQLETKLSKGKGMRKARTGQVRLRSNRVPRDIKNSTAAALGC